MNIGDRVIVNDLERVMHKYPGTPVGTKGRILNIIDEIEAEVLFEGIIYTIEIAYLDLI